MSYPHPKRWKLNTTLSMNRVGNSAQRFPELSVSLLGSLEVNSASHSPWVVRSKLSVSLPMGRSK
ncbi:hypothetical protein [Leptospira noguchii]|uniref:hypothetical protein n=1 Tax=Leptospira noguchii TaxID=28182 RepID=UPI001FB5CD05|nr:hypothetical protein [Leptospira noguchii]UOG51205.1 hypothetical protein MAL09_10700 [Leptospira noguchii]